MTPAAVRDATPPTTQSHKPKREKGTTETSEPEEKDHATKPDSDAGRIVSARKTLESALSRQLDDARRRERELAESAAAELDGLDGEEDEDAMSVDGDENAENIDPNIVVNARGGQPARATLISQFTPTEDNTNPTPGVSTTYYIQQGETIVLQGEYTLRVLSGAVSIYGATLTPESGTHTVFAPTTHALPVITAAPGKQKRGGHHGGGGYSAEILIGCHNSGIRDVGKLWPMLSSIWAPPSAVHKENSFHLLRSSTSPPALLHIPPSWQHLLSDLTTPSPHPPIILLAGPKSAGKSTFSRVLTNTLLDTYPKVAYLDLDPGQPEFSPPGMLSLSLVSNPILGPPFTHPAGPAGGEGDTRLKAHHLGWVTPREDPGVYLRCAASLFQTYHHHCDSDPSAVIPLVINTCGWIKGTGLELLQDIIALTHPSDLILLHPEPQYPADNLATAIADVHAIVPHTTRFYTAPPPPPPAVATPIRSSAADLRTLHTMSYFHHSHSQSPLGVGGGVSWSFNHPLTHSPPWILPAREVSAGIHILHLSPHLPASYLPAAIEGTIVGVVLVDPSHTQEDPEPEPETDTRTPTPTTPTTSSSSNTLPYPPLHPAPPPESSHCAGLAVIRAIDTGTAIDSPPQFQLVLPPGDIYLSHANTTTTTEAGQLLALVRGRLDLPIWDSIFVGDREGGSGSGSGKAPPGGTGRGGVAVAGEAGGEVAGEVPWVTYEGREGGQGQRLRGAGKWRVRRNLMRRGQQGRRG